ncbi:MAG: amidophosphoribosyltransferase [Rectinemataceae bacterium]|nr:amidophosphoribosyltransferase [Rectinemataceae bacterium]
MDPNEIEASRPGDIFAGDKARDECGVIAVSNAREDASRAAFYGLFALQHRGQESAGIASSDLKKVAIHKDLGLVAHVFTERDMASLTGPLAIGHTRYSTTGSSTARNAQPFCIETMHGPLALGHNGNLVNAATLRRKLLMRGVGLTSASDTEVMIMMLAAAEGATWPERIASCMKEWTGAFSFVVLTLDAVYAARDPWGLRPLSCGVLPGSGSAPLDPVATGSAAASESCALRTIGCTEIRDIGPGEIVELTPDGPVSRGGIEPSGVQASCIFEYIYFSRPDSVWNGIAVHEARRRFGAQIAREASVKADLVIPVPDSSISAAIGYSHASGIPYDEGFVKNRYIGRTFIQPTESLRKQGVAMKFMVMPEAVRGKRLVVVDDSIVRGNTTGPIIRLLREAGALEVHVRLTCPPIRHPCHMGVDMGTREQLIAHRLTVPQIRDAVGADSLEYLSIEGMMAALGRPSGFCTACFSGVYPFDTGEAGCKDGFEPC